MVLRLLHDMPCHTIGIKDDNQLDTGVAGIVREDIEELSTRGIEIHRSQCLQLLPGEHDIIAVDEQVVLFLHQRFLRPTVLCEVFFLFTCTDGPGTRDIHVLRPVFNRSVGTHEDILELLIGDVMAAVLVALVLLSLMHTLEAQGIRFEVALLYRAIQLERRLDMHVALHLVKRHDKASAMGTEDRGAWIQDVLIRVIAPGEDHLLRIMTAVIAAEAQGQTAQSLRVDHQLLMVVPHRHNRRSALEHCPLSLHLRSAEVCVHVREIRHRTADIVSRNVEREGIVRLQQDVLRLPESLAHRTVGRLTEIATLGMLVAGPSGHEGEANVGDRAAGEHTDMLPLLEMGQYETLPVDGERIGGAVGPELKTAAARERLQQKMHLGIVSERLEMAHTLDRCCNRFLVQDATG